MQITIKFLKEREENLYNDYHALRSKHVKNHKTPSYAETEVWGALQEIKYLISLSESDT